MEPWLQRGTPEHAAMFACKGCGTECAGSPGPGLAVCEKCCEDHDYEYRSDLRTKACKHCEKPVDPDWYD
jgi:hypothetical protein